MSVESDSAPLNWLIRKRGYYYRPDCRGYTGSVHEAGRYTEEFAKREAAIQPDIMEAVPLSSALSGYSDTDLMYRWLNQQYQRQAKRGGIPLWHKVEQQFCVGSTSAKDACTRHGFSPDVLVRKS